MNQTTVSSGLVAGECPPGACTVKDRRAPWKESGLAPIVHVTLLFGVLRTTVSSTHSLTRRSRELNGPSLYHCGNMHMPRPPARPRPSSSSPDHGGIRQLESGIGGCGLSSSSHASLPRNQLKGTFSYERLCRAGAPYSACLFLCVSRFFLVSLPIQEKRTPWTLLCLVGCSQLLWERQKTSYC